MQNFLLNVQEIHWLGPNTDIHRQKIVDAVALGPKGFKRVRYYGLQAACKLKKVAEILKQSIKRIVQGVFDWFGKEAESAVVEMSYRERMKKTYGKDPLLCE